MCTNGPEAAAPGSCSCSKWGELATHGVVPTSSQSPSCTGPRVGPSRWAPMGQAPCSGVGDMGTLGRGNRLSSRPACPQSLWVTLRGTLAGGTTRNPAATEKPATLPTRGPENSGGSGTQHCVWQNQKEGAPRLTPISPGPMTTAPSFSLQEKVTMGFWLCPRQGTLRVTQRGELVESSPWTPGQQLTGLLAVVLASLCSQGTCSECRLPGPVKPPHPPGSPCLIGGVLPVSLATQGLRASPGGGGLPLLHLPLQGTCEMKQLWTGRQGSGEGPSPGGHRLPCVGGYRPSGRAGGATARQPVAPRDCAQSAGHPGTAGTACSALLCPRVHMRHDGTFVCVCGCCGLVGKCSVCLLQLLTVHTREPASLSLSLKIPSLTGRENPT